MTTPVGDAGPQLAAPPSPSPSQPPYRDPDPATTGPFTPERPRASWWLRVLAVLLDSAIVATVVWFATGGSPGLAALPLLRVPDPPLSETATWWTGGTLLALGLLQAYTGMTPGKRVAGIAVVDAGSGRPIGLLGTVLRFLAHFLDAFLMIGYLRAGLHPQGRTFADSLLGTVVVKSTKPRPHRWVVALGRGRDAQAPWLRWLHWVTGGLALVLCAAGAAAWVVQSGGGSSGETTTSSCHGTGPLAVSAFVEASSRVGWESKLGVSRVTESAWPVAAGWTTGVGLPDDGAGGDLGDDGGASAFQTRLTVRSPAGTTYSTGGSAYGVFDASVWLPEPVGDVVGLDLPEDVSGWTAQVVLVGDAGEVLAECSATLPEIPRPDPSELS